MSTITERVQRGAKLLDEVRPGWAEEMRPGLELSSCTECVLGQLYGEYEAGFKEMISRFTGPYQLFSASAHGFTATVRKDGVQSIEEFVDLTLAWRREIALRGGDAA